MFGLIRNVGIQSAIQNLLWQPRLFLATQVSVKVKVKVEDETIAWENARPYSEIPGPSIWDLFRFFWQGGSLEGKSFLEVQTDFLRRYGNICKLPGILGKMDTIFIYEPEDMEKIYRNEGPYPKRINMETTEYYRKVHRKDVFKRSIGLGFEQGPAWWDFRHKVNPVMMMPKTTTMYLPKIDEISMDFVRKLHSSLGTNGSAPETILFDLNKWSLESVCYFFLDLRIGLLGETENPTALKFMNDIKLFFHYSYQLDSLPSVWKVYKTKMFKANIKVNDDIVDAALHFLEQGKDALAKRKLEDTDPDRVKGILERLLEIDENLAFIMTLDSIIAGIDTVTSSTFQILYALALYPEKQEKLRKEISRVLPNKDSKLTAENMCQMPYLRACLKESARYGPLFGSVRSAGCDMVLQGYQIPKDTNLVMVHQVQLRNDEQFVESDKFIPERYLRNKEAYSCPVGTGKGPHPFCNLPFGFGPRMCIGRRLAELEMETLICRLFRCYKVEWKGPPPTYITSFILIPNGTTSFYFTEIKD